MVTKTAVVLSVVPLHDTVDTMFMVSVAAVYVKSRVRLNFALTRGQEVIFAVVVRTRASLTQYLPEYPINVVQSVSRALRATSRDSCPNCAAVALFLLACIFFSDVAATTTRPVTMRMTIPSVTTASIRDWPKGFFISHYLFTSPYFVIVTVSVYVVGPVNVIVASEERSVPPTTGKKYIEEFVDDTRTVFANSTRSVVPETGVHTGVTS